MVSSREESTTAELMMVVVIVVIAIVVVLWVLIVVVVVIAKSKVMESAREEPGDLDCTSSGINGVSGRLRIKTWISLHSFSTFWESV